MTLTEISLVLTFYIVLDALITGYLINKTINLKPARRYHDIYIFVCSFVIGYILAILLRSLI